MESSGRVSLRATGWVRWLLALAVTAMALDPQPAVAGSITGVSWDGSPPGTLADISGKSSFAFGLSAFSAGVYEVTWLGGVTDWRGVTTIGGGTEVLFDPGYVAVGTERTISMANPWTMWASTPDLDHAESTGAQWAFASLGTERWAWGLEDIAVGRCDCDFQDAYGLLQRLSDVESLTLAGPGPASDPPRPTPPPDSPQTAENVVTAVPEPGTIALVTIGLAGLGARRRICQPRVRQR